MSRMGAVVLRCELAVSMCNDANWLAMRPSVEVAAMGREVLGGWVGPMYVQTRHDRRVVLFDAR